MASGCSTLKWRSSVVVDHGFKVVSDFLSCCGGPAGYCLHVVLVAVGVMLVCLLMPLLQHGMC